MSSDQPVFPTQPTTVDSSQMCGDVTAGVMSTDWYTPAPVCRPSGTVSTNAAQQPCRDGDDARDPPSAQSWLTGVQYVYNEAYITPFPSSTVENQPWPQYARASVPDLSYHIPLQQHHLHQPQLYLHDSQLQQQQPSTLQQHHQFQLQPHHAHSASQAPPKDSSRPRSSPSTFGPSTETMNWTTSAGLGIQYSGITDLPQPTPTTSAFPQEPFPAYPMEAGYSTATSPPEIRAPQPRRPYTSIAPNPSGVPKSSKRRREDDDPGESAAITLDKRRKRTSPVASADLNEDDRFLVQLKDDQNLPWKDISTRFQTDRGQTVRVATLQMRYKRLREKSRNWEDADMKALRHAHDYWEKYKWEIISDKMKDYGLTERWPSRYCARKWQELEISLASAVATAGITPAIPQFSSPVDASVHFAFMPMQ